MAAHCGSVRFSRREVARIIFRAMRDTYGAQWWRAAYVALREAKPICIAVTVRP